MLLSLMIISFYACTTNPESHFGNNNSNFQNDMTIKAGFTCGWGSGTDTIEISGDMIKYKYYVPRKSDEPQIINSRKISEMEWKEIISLFNLNEFEKLDIDECHTCYDGCDEWISIETEKISNKITYQKDISIESIKNLQKKLSALREELNK